MLLVAISYQSKAIVYKCTYAIKCTFEKLRIEKQIYKIEICKSNQSTSSLLPHTYYFPKNPDRLVKSEEVKGKRWKVKILNAFAFRIFCMCGTKSRFYGMCVGQKVFFIYCF